MCHRRRTKRPEGKLKIKKALWRESDKEIKAEMENLTKSDIQTFLQLKEKEII